MASRGNHDIFKVGEPGNSTKKAGASALKQQEMGFSLDG